MYEREIVLSIALSKIKGLGCRTFKKLIERFNTAENLFENGEELYKFDKNIFNEILSIKDEDIDKAYRELEKSYKLGLRVLVLSDKEYPKLLKEIPDPPFVLYVKGRLPISEKSISVVGTRKPSPYGIYLVEKIVRPLARYKLNIVSGVASGIDYLSHKVAIDEESFTTGVLGHGIDTVYPPENRYIYDKICENGCLISEFPLGTKPTKYTFPQRNRIIAGLSYATTVIEASEKSGSLITARYADGYGRLVFVPPSNINVYSATGNNLLIKRNIAYPITDVEDIFVHLPFLREKNPSESEVQLSQDEKSIIEFLTLPRHIDEIMENFGFGSDLESMLFNLSLKGLVKEEGGYYFRIG